MARIRTIKPEFWTHEDLSAQPEATHMLAAALLNYADDEGYFNANPGLIKAACSPLREPSVSVHDSISRLVAIGYIETFNGTDGKRYGRVVKFDDHQRVNRPTPSKIKDLCAESEASPPTHGVLSDPSPPERNREQGTGNREGEVLASDDAPPAKPAASNVHPHPASDRVVAVVLDAYHETLPNCARVEVVNPKRAKRIHAADKLARQVCRQQGWPYDPADFWQGYFGECDADPWLRGDTPNPKNPRWKQNLHVLIEESRFAEIMDGAIARLKAEAA